jgi:hypothetical protein
MSTLVAQTISNGTVSTSSANVIQGSARAWVSFNGANGTVYGTSFNVSSITRTPSGLYTINLTNAMPNINYSAIGSVSTVADTGAAFLYMYTGNSYTATAPTTSSFLISCVNFSATYVDPVYVNIAVFSS